ncbi:MAG: DUF2769 domain-containing protein [Patescibacteria group bacterium]
METQKNLKNTPANRAICACVNCPSYNDCAREKAELLFCAAEIGPGTCDYKMNGCLCGPCPIHREYDLKSGYYCLNK